ncbi:TPA: hypothetical protein ACUNBZ_004141, partial [Escherichia fergusonii]
EVNTVQVALCQPGKSYLKTTLLLLVTRRLTHSYLAIKPQQHLLFFTFALFFRIIPLQTSTSNEVKLVREQYRGNNIIKISEA